MIISVCERGGRVHSTAADKADVRQHRDGDVSVILHGGGKVLGTLALSSSEARELCAALKAAFPAEG